MAKIARWLLIVEIIFKVNVGILDVLVVEGRHRYLLLSKSTRFQPKVGQIYRASRRQVWLSYVTHLLCQVDWSLYFELLSHLSLLFLLLQFLPLLFAVFFVACGYAVASADKPDHPEDDCESDDRRRVGARAVSAGSAWLARVWAEFNCASLQHASILGNRPIESESDLCYLG